MPKTTIMTSSDVSQRAGTAREHLQVAQEQHSYIGASMEPTSSAQVSASNAILAGIAAADAICGKVLGERSNDADHRSATTLLSSVLPDGPALSTRLSRLLRDKSLIQYGGYCTATKAEDMIRQAKFLVESMTTVHRL